jgi:hypothetical protein
MMRIVGHVVKALIAIGLIIWMLKFVGINIF